MAIALVTIADSISGLSVSGVTIKDINQVPNEVLERDVPMIIPRPDGFVTNFKPERVTLGSGAGAKWNVTYDLTYRLLYAKVGTGRGLFDLYSGLCATAMLFVDAIMDNDALTGTVDIQLSNISDFGPVVDPSGQTFHGCDFVFTVLEFQD